MLSIASMIVLEFARNSLEYQIKVIFFLLTEYNLKKITFYRVHKSFLYVFIWLSSIHDSFIAECLVPETISISYHHIVSQNMLHILALPREGIDWILVTEKVNIFGFGQKYSYIRKIS